MQNKILKICIIGRTNAGKSTLINNIVGEKISIQNKKINTTQDLILGVFNINDTQLLFYDTPGSNFLNSKVYQTKELKTNLWNGIEKSDVIIYLIDSYKINFKFLYEQFKKIQELNKKIIIVFNKVDLIKSKDLLPVIKQISKKYKFNSYFLISAKKNIGIKDLLLNLEKNSYIAKWIYTNDEITDKDDKFIFNELLRETLLTNLHKEIPYNLEIKTTQIKQLKNNNIKIKQKIFLKESRYKKIILGKKGEKIKKIRVSCQKKISEIYKAKVHLYIELLNL